MSRLSVRLRWLGGTNAVRVLPALGLALAVLLLFGLACDEEPQTLTPDPTNRNSIRLAVVIVIDRQEYEAYHGAWPRHLFFLLPESGRGIGYARSIFK